MSDNTEKLTVSYDARLFEVEIEEIKIQDKKISGNWGDILYRLHFKMTEPTEKANYRFLIE